MSWGELIIVSAEIIDGLIVVDLLIVALIINIVYRLVG